MSLIQQRGLQRVWGELNLESQKAVLEELRSLPLELQEKQKEVLFATRQEEKIYIPWQKSTHEVSSAVEDLGKDLLSKGKVACLVLTGGAGSRMGSPFPKGMIPVSLIKKKSLIQILCEKTLYAGLRYKRKLPLIFMTSPSTHQEIVDFLEKHRYFGLEQELVYFFTQEELPLCDEKGNWFLSSSGKLAKGPDGNGRCLHLFYDSGLFDVLFSQGVEYLQVVPVDNALADPFDAAFVGLHHTEQSEVSIKSVERASKDEEIGVLASFEGSLRVVEYNELGEELKKQEQFSLGHTGLYCFSFSFIASLVRLKHQLPWHVAWKKAKQWPSGEEKLVAKFESFLFDVFAFATKFSVLVCPRSSCFSPLKNATGSYSLRVVAQDLLALDRQMYLLLTGKRPPSAPFELSLAFYYLTPEQRAFYREKGLAPYEYIESIFR